MVAASTLARVILPATAEHVPACVALGRRLHDESPRWAAMPYDERRASHWLTASLEACGLFVATLDGAVVGFTCNVVHEFFFNDVLRLANIGMYVAPEFRGGRLAAGLLRAAERWGKSQGAVESCVGSESSDDIERTGRWFERMGYERCGLDYRREL